MPGFLDSLSSGFKAIAPTAKALAPVAQGYLDYRGAKNSAQAQERIASNQLNFAREQDALQRAQLSAGLADRQRQQNQISEGFNRAILGRGLTPEEEERLANENQLSGTSAIEGTDRVGVDLTGGLTSGRF